MADVFVKVRDNGPLLIEGPIKIVDAEGNIFPVAPDKPAIAFCRCGLSGNKPFCDGAHKNVFQSTCRAPAAT